MKNNYYDNIIIKVKNLIAANDYNAAIEILTTELTQVYIPHYYEDIFHELYNEAESYITNVEEEMLIVDKKELSLLLKGDREQQFLAINSLDQLNLRNYLDIISKYFLSDQLPQLKGRLLDLCVGQNIDGIFEFKLNEEIIDVNPSQLESVDEMEFITFAFDYFNNHLYKNPSLINICQIALVEKIYSIYPKVFLIDNVESVCQSIIAEVGDMFDLDSIEAMDNYYN